MKKKKISKAEMIRLVDELTAQNEGVIQRRRMHRLREAQKNIHRRRRMRRT